MILIGSLWLNSAAAQGTATPKRAAAPNPALARIEDIAGLPRVLLLGDSISIGYTLRVRELLKGKANVHRPSANCSSTGYALQNLDKWLGDQPWDVIHFNFGLHDAKLPPEGVRHSPPDLYKSNLEALIDRLQKKSKYLIFATTTPVPNGGNLSPVRRFGSIETYNSVASSVMRTRNIPINDLNALVVPKADRILIHRTDEQGIVHWDVHFTTDGYNLLAEQVAAAIQNGLKQLPSNVIAPHQK